MDKTFWHGKWERGELGFHQAQGNPLLKQHFDQLGLARGARVFVPLCGKTGDIPWLLSCGCQVVGCELSELAVQELFQELGVSATVTEHGSLKHYSTSSIDLWVGDLFELTHDHLGTVDAVYDRAALVALPDSLRADYARQLTRITGRAPQLLICFEYEQTEMTGPPFAIHEHEVRQLYPQPYRVQLINRVPVTGGLKGHVTADEAVWLVQPDS